MKLSILIPVYNVEEYIHRCLDSVYPQLENEDEVIIVDDGSTDLSGVICDAYLQSHPSQTYVYHKKNEGAYPTRNYALDRCSGDYVWFIDPDDYIQDGAIRKIKQYINDNDPEVMSLSYKRFSRTNVKSIENSFDVEECLNGINYLKNNMFNAYLWSHVYRREFLIKNSIRFNEGLNTQGDWLFNIYVSIKANKILITNIYAYNYYIDNPNSTLKNPQLKHRIRCVNNSLVAIKELNNLISNQQNLIFNKYLERWMSFIVSSFVYSLFQVGFNVKFVKRKLNVLKDCNLYPISYCKFNRKADLFIFVSNIEFLFICICWFHNCRFIRNLF